MDEEKELSSDSQNDEYTDSERQLHARATKAESRLKEYEQKLKELEDSKSTGASPDKEKELQAKSYLKSLLKEVTEEEKKALERAEREQQERFERDVDEALLLNTDIKRAEFLKFIKDEADQYGVQTVQGAVTLFRRFQDVASSASEKTKKDLSKKPGLPASDGSGEAPAYKDEGKSLYDIVNEAKKELKN